MPNQLDDASSTTAPAAPVARSVFVTEIPAEEGSEVDRRSEARYPAKEPAEVEILFGGAEPVFGLILDVSRSGMRIAIPKRLSRGEQVKVKFHRNVIFGEVRYCRAVASIFHAGIRIHDLVRVPGHEDQHLSEETLSLYAVGKGLSVSEVIDVREHLVRCETCRANVADRQAQLNPSRKKLGREPRA
ncbi:MAG TPA: PilZ domain-containing protein [Bryobacteraceae bacterium]|nr:PilZ domain-containing protein [Bryobacteraceae bacterium]